MYLLLDSIVGERDSIHLFGRRAKGARHPEQRYCYYYKNCSNLLMAPHRFTVARHHVSGALHSLDVLGSLRRIRKPWKRVGHDANGERSWKEMSVDLWFV